MVSKKAWPPFVRYSLVPVCYLLACMSCATPDTLGSLDLVKWRGDRGGCAGNRLTQIADLKAVKEQLKGKMANDINKILGRPDINQLDDRNQKYYVYFLEQGPHCQDRKLQSEARSVALRISAIGLVTEVTFQRGEP